MCGQVTSAVGPNRWGVVTAGWSWGVIFSQTILTPSAAGTRERQGGDGGRRGPWWQRARPVQLQTHGLPLPGSLRAGGLPWFAEGRREPHAASVCAAGTHGAGVHPSLSLPGS